jgi:ABC-type Fe3+ transport system permease subunit
MSRQIEMAAFLSRFVGLVLVTVMLAAIVVDATKSIAASSLTVTSLGQWWFALDRDSLDAFRQFVQVSIDPYLGGWVWNPSVQTILSLPTWLVFGAPGALLIALAPVRRRRRQYAARSLPRV